MDNIIIYDWLSFTSKVHSPEDIISILGLEGVSWDTVKGSHGYKDRLYWNCISIHFNGTPDQGVWLEMSGQGCRAFETVGHGDYDFLFKMILCLGDQMNLTRLDIAFDDHQGILDIDDIINDTVSGNYISKAKSWECIQGSKGKSVVIGSRQSPVLIRIYDKAAERNLVDGSHWIRVELQLRDERALGFIKNSPSIGEGFTGVLLNYLRYVVPDLSDSNRWRWPMTSYWSDLVGSAERIKIYYAPGIEYNLERCKKFVYEQAGNSIATLLAIEGTDNFLCYIQERQKVLRGKYRQLINDYYYGEQHDKKQ